MVVPECTSELCLQIALLDCVSQSTPWSMGMDASNYNAHDYVHLLVITGRDYLRTMQHAAPQPSQTHSSESTSTRWSCTLG